MSYDDIEGYDPDSMTASEMREAIHELQTALKEYDVDTPCNHFGEGAGRVWSGNMEPGAPPPLVAAVSCARPECVVKTMGWCMLKSGLPVNMGAFHAYASADPAALEKLVAAGVPVIRS